MMARTKEEEDAYNIVQERNVPKPSGLLGSIAHMVKGALGAGMLSGHVAYMRAGVVAAIVLNVLCGLYMGYCFYMLGSSAQVLCRRARVPVLTYPDVGEAAVALFPNRKIAKYSKAFRYIIDFIIVLELFGSCATYQIIISKSIKQLVENTQTTSIEGISEGYPGLRVYLACMCLPIILICLITHLKWLAPFSMVANVLILFCIGTTVYYAIENNPHFENMAKFTEISKMFQFIGMSVFSMSCAGVVIPVENNMKEPNKYPFVILVGMSCIISGVFLVSFFGYVAYLDKSESPITMNFPMTTVPKILKGFIAAMIYVTHALNYWVPFTTLFYYIKNCHSQKNIHLWELLYRALFVIVITIIAITFPDINALMGFLGCFCLSNIGFIFPNIVYLLTIWERPGFGKYYWRLWKVIALLFFGVVILICGSIVNAAGLIKVFTSNV